MASTRSSCKDLLERISPGSPQDLLLRSCARSCKDILERNLAGSPLPREFTMNRPQTKSPRRRLCGSLRSRNAHGHLTRAILCDNFAGKMPRSKIGTTPRRRLCASLRSQNANPSVWTLFGEIHFVSHPGHPNDPRLLLFPFSIETFNHWVRFRRYFDETMVGPWFSPPGPVIIVFKIVKNRHNPGSPNFKNLQKLFIALPVFGSKSALEIRLKHQAAEVIAEVKPMVPGAHVPMAHVSTAMPRPHVHRVAYVAIGHVAAQPGKAWKTQHNSTTCWLLLVFNTPWTTYVYTRIYV